MAWNRRSRASWSCRRKVLLIDEKAPLLGNYERLIGTGTGTSRGRRSVLTLRPETVGVWNRENRSQGKNRARDDAGSHSILL
jgi:hypothetical protein